MNCARTEASEMLSVDKGHGGDGWATQRRLKGGDPAIKD